MGLQKLLKVHCWMSKIQKWEKNRSMMLQQRNRALGMLEAEMAVTHVTRNIDDSHCTISRLRTKFNATGSLNKRAQRALGCSPEEKVKGHSGAIYREPQGHNLNTFGRGPCDDVIYYI